MEEIWSRRLCEHKGRDWKDTDTSQGLGATRSCPRGQEVSSLRDFRGPWLCQQADFGLLASRTTREYISSVLSHQIVKMCYTSPRKLASPWTFSSQICSKLSQEKVGAGWKQRKGWINVVFHLFLSVHWTDVLGTQTKVNQTAHVWYVTGIWEHPNWRKTLCYEFNLVAHISAMLAMWWWQFVLQKCYHSFRLFFLLPF